MTERCPFCRLNGEDKHHLFLSCTLAQQVWNSFLGPLGLNVAQYNSTHDLLLNWPVSQRITSVGKVLWRKLPHAVFWVLWLERNMRIFEEIDQPVFKLIQSVKEACWNWSLGEHAIKDIYLEDIMFSWDSLILS